MKIIEIHEDGAFEVLEHEKDMTRIGDGSFRSQKLSKRAMKRALKVIKHFSDEARENKARFMLAVTTSAVRDAKNGRAFVKELLKKTGIRARIISGEEEGRLIFLGAASSPDKNRNRILAIDIGGGSAELVLGGEKKIDHVESLPLGVARLRDRFISKDPPSKDNLRSLENHIEDMVASVVKIVSRKKFRRVIGTGGTMINLASMVYEMKEGRRLRLRGYFELKKKDLMKLHQKLVRLRVKRLEKTPGLDKKRAKCITTGSLLVTTLMRLLRTDRIFVSDKGIREGMILDYLLKKKLRIKNVPPNVRVQWFGEKPFFSGRIL